MIVMLSSEYQKVWLALGLRLGSVNRVSRMDQGWVHLDHDNPCISHFLTFNCWCVFKYQQEAEYNNRRENMDNPYD